jgi:hypothetical protein
MESAYQMSLDHNVWERPLGLAGSWGGHIEDWLDGLLPGDAAGRCSGRVGLVVTQLPSCQQVREEEGWEEGHGAAAASSRKGFAWVGGNCSSCSHTCYQSAWRQALTPIAMNSGCTPS